MHRTALEVRENSLLDPSGPRLKASSVTTIRSSAHEEEEEASWRGLRWSFTTCSHSQRPLVLHFNYAASRPRCYPANRLFFITPPH